MWHRALGACAARPRRPPVGRARGSRPPRRQAAGRTHGWLPFADDVALERLVVFVGLKGGRDDHGDIGPAEDRRVLHETPLGQDVDRVGRGRPADEVTEDEDGVLWLDDGNRLLEGAHVGVGSQEMRGVPRRMESFCQACCLNPPPAYLSARGPTTRRSSMPSWESSPSALFEGS